jgi:large subunit ribosomal protein L31
MKKGIHPEMHTVIYKDISTEHCFLSQSTTRAKETMKWEDGNEYPVIKVEISSDSHPFYTGKHRAVAVEGRVQRFMKRYGQKDSGQT